MHSGGQTDANIPANSGQAPRQRLGYVCLPIQHSLLVWDIASAERPVFCHCCPADAPCGASHVLHSVLCPPDIHLEHRHSQISLASILRNSKLSASASSAVSITHHTIQTPSSASILRNSKLQQVLQLSITHHTTQTPSPAYRSTMAFNVGPYELRRRSTLPKDTTKTDHSTRDLINHFNTSKTAEKKEQASEFAAFQQAVRSTKRQRKTSRGASIDRHTLQPSIELPQRPKLKDFSHIVIPTSNIRTQPHIREGISDEDPYWNTLNIPAFNQERAEFDEDVLNSPSPASSELSSVNDSILASTPEALRDSASTMPTTTTTSTSGPRLGVFVESPNAEPPLFDYSAAARQLREYNYSIGRGGRL